MVCGVAGGLTGIHCAYCESENIKANAKHPTMPFRCNECKKQFSVKTNSMMHASKIGYQKWAIAIYLMTTNLKGASSMKLHRDLGNHAEISVAHGTSNP